MVLMVLMKVLIRSANESWLGVLMKVLIRSANESVD